MVTRYNQDGSKAPPTYKDRVTRIYPRAKCVEYDDGACYTIWANNGTGNVLAQSSLSPQDAWKRAAAAVVPPRRATR